MTWSKLGGATSEWSVLGRQARTAMDARRYKVEPYVFLRTYMEKLCHSRFAFSGSGDLLFFKGLGRG